MGSVIGIFSAKGGVGKTLLATNLAVAFGLGHKQRSAVIDLNPGIGTADLLLDLEPERSWFDLVEVIDELTPQQLKLAVTEYRPGVDLLACPDKISWDHPLTQKGLASLLDVCRDQYDLIVLDTPSGTSGLARISLELVDLPLIVLTPDAPTLRATLHYINGLPSGKASVGLVINQLAQGAAVTPTEIKDHLGQRLLGVLPIDPKGVWTNISYGEPCVLRKSSKLGRAIRQLSGRLLKVINSG